MQTKFSPSRSQGSVYIEEEKPVLSKKGEKGIALTGQMGFCIFL
jgi:hypothetical protein